MLEQTEKDQRATALLLADSRRENLMAQAKTKPKDTESEGKKRIQTIFWPRELRLTALARETRRKTRTKWVQK
jgi:hypothetical protein